MRQMAFACAFALLAVSCGGGSGSAPAVCVSGQACTPSGASDPCTAYATACDPVTKVQSCVATGPLADGDACGSGKVCLAHACIQACVPGVACTPATVDTCRSYATACSERLTSSSCAVGGNQPDGTSCGVGSVCSAGSCVAVCTPGGACQPVGTPDPCKTYAFTCTSNLAQQVCTPASDQPDGTTCNGTSVCQAGTCLGALAPPTLTPPGGSGAPGLAVRIASPDAGATIYYTTDNTQPSDDPATVSSSFLGSGTVTLQATTVVRAFAKLGLRKSVTVTGVYTITQPTPTPTPPPVGVSLGSGFTSGSVQANGAAAIAGTRLRLTPAVAFQAASAFHPSALNVQSFTTDFSFQILNPAADGFTFTIQGVGPYAMGSQGGGLGYGPDPFDSKRTLSIERSVAVKFDLFDNEGEGPNSTGLFTNGAVPTIPAVDLTPSGINLHSGHVFDVHMVYDGSNLTLTITDRATTPVSTFTRAFPIDIPAQVGDVTGYVGFTAGTGSQTATHEILNWTYANAR